MPGGRLFVGRGKKGFIAYHHLFAYGLFVILFGVLMIRKKTCFFCLTLWGAIFTSASKAGYRFLRWLAVFKAHQVPSLSNNLPNRCFRVFVLGLNPAQKVPRDP